MNTIGNACRVKPALSEPYQRSDSVPSGVIEGFKLIVKGSLDKFVLLFIFPCNLP